LKFGTSAAYLLARLQRDFENGELKENFAKKYADGEFKSVRAATMANVFDYSMPSTWRIFLTPVNFLAQCYRVNGLNSRLLSTA